MDTLLNLVADLGLAEPLSRGTTVLELLESHGWTPRAAIPLTWIFRKLAAEDHLLVDGAGADAVYRAPGPLRSGDPDRAEARAQALDPHSAPPFAVVRAMVVHVPSFLRGSSRGRFLFTRNRRFCSILFPRQLFPINNRLGAEAVPRASARTPRGPRGDGGAPLGGPGRRGAAPPRRRARQARSYVFTEIFPTFLRRAERKQGAVPALPVDSCGST